MLSCYRKESLLTLISLALVAGSFAQITQHKIDPSATAAEIKTIHGPHLALYDPSVKHRDKLLLFIVGTNGGSGDWLNFAEYAAKLGYHALCLDYKNTVITTTCVESKDSACFDGFRKEIMFGTPVSDLVDVDSANSIINRTIKGLQWLAKNFPNEGWGQYFSGNNIKWQSVVAAGHSQGAGHVAYLGKRFLLDRIIILAGPQDYLAMYHSPAPWQKLKSTTPLQNIYACLHVKDPYGFDRQLANCNAIMQNTSSDTTMVNPGMQPVKPRHIFVASNETKDAHFAFHDEAFRPVWDFLLQR
jgi:hypothetical protein